jgi:hypothetical protein
MKEVITFDDKSSMVFSPEDVRNTIVVMSGLSAFLGQKGKRDLDITSYDSGGDISWSIWTLRSAYSIFDKARNTFIDVKSRQEFLEKIKDQYPEDLEFFIWNPDVFDGYWDIPTGD